MALSAELARLRRERVTAPFSETPSILFSRREAAQLSFEDVRELGLNGLQALTSVSPALRDYEERLYLKSGSGIRIVDRALFSPEQEAQVGKAVVGVAKWLSPMFLLRAAQKVLEWLVRGLRCDVFGSEKEVDALVAMALPYHTTPEFVRFLSVITRERIRREEARKWRFLTPVMTQQKPVRREFVVRNISSKATFAIFKFAKRSAQDGVLNSSLCAFVATVLTESLGLPKRIDGKRTGDPASERRLIVAALEILGLGRETHNVAALSELQSAAIMVIVGACKEGLMLQDEDILLKTLCKLSKLLRWLHQKGQGSTRLASLYQGALAAFVYIICLSGVRCLPVYTVLKLVKISEFPAHLFDVTEGNTSARDAVMKSYASSLSRNLREHESFGDALTTLVSLPRTGLSSYGMRELLIELFSACADGDAELDSSSSSNQVLQHIIRTASKGPYAKELDEAIRHFMARNAASEKAFTSFKNTLCGILGGTGQYPAAKFSARVNQRIIFAGLDHPDVAVRLTAVKELPKLTDCIEEVTSALFRRLSLEDNCEVMQELLTLPSTITLCGSSAVMDILVTKIVALQDVPRGSGTLNETLVSIVLEGIRRIGCGSNEYTLTVKAFVSILSLMASKPFTDAGDLVCENAVVSIKGFAGCGEGFLQKIGTEITESMGCLHAPGATVDTQVRIIQKPQGNKSAVTERSRKQRTQKNSRQFGVGKIDKISGISEERARLLSVVSSAVSRVIIAGVSEKKAEYLDVLINICSQMLKNVSWWALAILRNACVSLRAMPKIKSMGLNEVLCSFAIRVGSNAVDFPACREREVRFVPSSDTKTAPEAAVQHFSRSELTECSLLTIVSVFDLLRLVNSSTHSIAQDFLEKSFRLLASYKCETGLQYLLQVLGSSADDMLATLSTFLRDRLVHSEDDQSLAYALEALVGLMNASDGDFSNKMDFLLLDVIRYSCSRSIVVRCASRNCAAALSKSLAKASQNTLAAERSGGLTLADVQCVLDHLATGPVDRMTIFPPVFASRLLLTGILKSDFLHKCEKTFPDISEPRLNGNTEQKISCYILEKLTEVKSCWRDTVGLLRFIRGKMGTADVECQAFVYLVNKALLDSKLQQMSCIQGLNSVSRGSSERPFRVDGEEQSEESSFLEVIFLVFERIEHCLAGGQKYNDVLELMNDVCTRWENGPESLPLFLSEIAVYAAFRMVCCDVKRPGHERLISCLINCACHSSPLGSLSFAFLRSLPQLLDHKLLVAISTLRKRLELESGNGKQRYGLRDEEATHLATRTAMAEVTSSLELFCRLHSAQSVEQSEKVQRLNVMRRASILQEEVSCSEIELLAVLLDTIKYIFLVADKKPEELLAPVQYILQLMLSSSCNVLPRIAKASLASTITAELVESIQLCISHASGDSSSTEDPMRAAIGASAIRFITHLSAIVPEVLVTQLTPTLLMLARSRDHLYLDGLKALLPPLISAGLDVGELVTKLVPAVYGEEPAELDRSALLACICAAKNKGSVLSAFLGAFAAFEEDRPFYVKEIITVVQGSKLGLVEELKLICSHQDVCALTTAYFSQSSFLDLFSRSAVLLSEKSSSRRTESEVEAYDGVISEIVLLLEKVISSASDERGAALGSIFGIAPVELLIKFLEQAISKSRWGSVYESLGAFLSRLSMTSVPFWSAKSPKPDELLATQMTPIVVSVLSLHGEGVTTSDPRLAPDGSSFKEGIWILKQRAANVLFQMCDTLGHLVKDTMAPSARVLVTELESEEVSSSLEQNGSTSISEANIACRAYGASLALSLAAVIREVGSNAVQYIPSVAMACAGMISSGSTCEAGKSGKGKGDPVVESAVRSLRSLVKVAPRLIPGDAVTQVLSGARQGGEGVQNVARELCLSVKPVVALSALVTSLDFERHPRITPFLLSLACGVVSSMSREEIKKCTSVLFSLVEESLLAREQLWESFEEPTRFLEDVRRTEGSAAQLVVAWGLRLPESEFKRVVQRLYKWSDEEGKHVYRKTGLYTVVKSLFDKLKNLFGPIFLDLMNDIFQRFEVRRKPDGESDFLIRVGNSRKRRRDEFEGKNGDIWELQELVLKCVIAFLRHVSGAVASDKVLKKLLECIMIFFDNVASSASKDYTLPWEALAALGKRIVSNGAAAEARDESRRMLTLVSRTVLERSNAVDWSVRAAAAEAARRLCLGAGEEYLAALPEAMPALQDMIEDENETVEKSARELVTTLEELTGESIMVHLRS